VFAEVAVEIWGVVETQLKTFADDGRIYLCKRVLFTPENRFIRLSGAAATVATYAIRELRSIWIP